MANAIITPVNSGAAMGATAAAPAGSPKEANPPITILDSRAETQAQTPQAPKNSPTPAAKMARSQRLAQMLSLAALASAAGPALAAGTAETIEALAGPIGLRGAILGTFAGAATAGIAATKIIAADKFLGIRFKALVAGAAVIAGAVAGGIGGIAGGWILGSISGGLFSALAGLGIEKEIKDILNENKDATAANIGHILGEITGRWLGRRARSPQTAFHEAPSSPAPMSTADTLKTACKTITAPSPTAPKPSSSTPMTPAPMSTAEPLITV